MSKLNLSQTVEAFSILGQELQKVLDKKPDANKELLNLIETQQYENAWFTPFFVRKALDSLLLMLDKDNLQTWLQPYKNQIEKVQKKQRVGVIMAGNLPLVGFHDFLCVLLSGAVFVGKLSSQDKYLLPQLSNMLITIEPRLKEQICFTEEKLGTIDKIIATGSSNSARTFAYYFKNYPSIIRSHCNSVAVLSGKESEAELSALSDDIMLYFGLGCRSVSKLYVPENYDFTVLFEQLDNYRPQMATHHKYLNNLEYQKTLHLVNLYPFYDQGLLVVKQESSLASPIAVLHYQYYQNLAECVQEVKSLSGALQCAVSNAVEDTFFLPLGSAQQPQLSDYANGIDTMRFLLEIK